MNSPKRTLSIIATLLYLFAYCICLPGNISAKDKDDINKTNLENYQYLPETTDNKLSQIEKKLFGYVNKTDNIEARVVLIEKEILGYSKNTDDLNKRIEEINRLLAVSETLMPHDFNVSSDTSQDTFSDDTQNHTVKSSGNKISADSLQMLKDQTKYSAILLDIINQERKFRNLAPLNLDPIGNKLALEQASYLIQTKQFSHYGVDEENPDQRYMRHGGTGKVTEIVDGFFASYNENEQIQTINLDVDFPHNLMDAILESQDKSDTVFSNESNLAGVAFVLSSDKKQLVIVIEIITDYISLSEIPVKTSPGELYFTGKIPESFKFTWIGLAKADARTEFQHETEAMPYFPPMDEVLYTDKKAGRLKGAGQVGALIVAAAAAPFTYGASIMVMDIIMQQINQTYQAKDIQVRSGVDANIDGSFKATINLGEKGPGLYYVSIWSNVGKSKKPVIISRQVVKVV